MNVYKHHVTDFIKCPYLFAKNVLSSTKPQPKNTDYKKFRDHLMEISAYEMKNNLKLDLHEYRIRYTNKFYTNAEQVFTGLAGDSLIAKLNNLFAIFADNAFFGYNIPVEIAVPNTAVIYKDSVDFGLIDDEKNITFVDIVNLASSEIPYKDMIRNWVHYYITYSYLANSFDQKIHVILLDPVAFDRIDVAFLPDRYNMDLDRLGEIIKPIEAGLLYRNLFACPGCNLVGDCK